MTETTGLIHIERDGFKMKCWIGVKEEGGIGINESLYKPGRGDAIDSWPWTCDPGTALIFHFGYPALPDSLLSGHRMFCLVEGFFGSCLERRIEKVDLDNLFKSSFQSRQMRRESLRGRFELLNLPDERHVVGFALFAELLLEHIGWKVIDC